MIRIEDGCVECGKPCIGDSCPYRNEKHYYCDECGEECDPDYMLEINGEMVCIDCLPAYLVDNKIAEEVKR